MARSIKEIEQVQLDKMAEEPNFQNLEILTDNELQTLENLNSDSKVAVWRLWLFVTAFCINVFEQLMDSYERRLEERIAETRVHTKLWYQEKALSFQFGDQTDNNGNYDNSNITAQEIEERRVFKYAAVQRLISGGVVILRIKVAKDDGENLGANSEAEVIAGQSFMIDNSDAGTQVDLTTGPGDDLKLEIDIYFDPQILDADGKRLDGTTDTPVIDRIQSFLKQIEFNGRYVKTFNTDALQEVHGVIIPVIRNAASRYAQHAYDSENVANAGLIDQIRVADSGYFKLDIEATTINYIANDE